MLLQIRIRIGIKTMSILMRILPKILHLLENQIVLLLNTVLAVYVQWFIFLSSVKCVKIVCILDSSILKLSGTDPDLAK